MINRYIPFIALLLLPGAGLWAKPVTANPADSTIRPDELRKATVRALIRRVEGEHFAPETINDSFSAIVWKRFIQSADPEKHIFLQADIDHLKKYQYALDDQLHTPSIEFFDTVMAVYRKRAAEAQDLYRSLLSRPVALNSRRTYQTNREHAGFPADANARRVLWQDQLTWYLLKKAAEPGDSLSVHATESQRQAWNERNRDKIRRWLDNLFKRALTPQAESDKFSLYMSTITTAMDPHSLFFAPVEARIMNEQMSHRYYGLGMELRNADGDTYIQRLMPGGSAYKSGLLQVNDRILGVSGSDREMVDIAGMETTDVAKLIRGEKGTAVRLQVAAPGANSRTVDILREEITQEEAGAKGAVVYKDGKKYGYILLPEFYQDVEKLNGVHCYLDVLNLVKAFQAEKVDGILMDLRNNPGGSLQEVVAMISIFAGEGPAVQLKDKNGIQVLVNPGLGKVYDGPLAVLINESSASASEIFAAAMQDYKRAILLGSPSFGKGTAQATLPMGKMGDTARNIPNISYGSVRLTIEKFYRINGGSTQLKGVTPDLLLSDGREGLPMHEKDQPSALSWDVIPPASYDTVRQDRRMQVIRSANARLSLDTALNTIQREGAWSAGVQKDAIPLDLGRFLERNAAINAHMERMKNAQKLDEKQALDVRAISNTGNPDKEAAARLEQWFRLLRSDSYILHGVDVLKDLSN